MRTAETTLAPRRFGVVGPAALVAIVVVAAASVAWAPDGGSPLTWWRAAVLGVVEGITEFLPVSSTGHLTLTAKLLGLGGSGRNGSLIDSYTIAIQAGAILAVLGLYRQRLGTVVQGVLGRDPEGRRVAIALVASFIPAAVVGVVLGDTIKEHLFGLGPVAGAWIVGGLAILVFARRGPRDGGRPLESITVNQALIIGGAQALALWPGVSRSLVTLLAAVLLGLSLKAAIEYSFLLGALTLGAATAYEAMKDGPAMIEEFGWIPPLIGLLAAFVSAVLAVRWLVDYLGKHSLAIFGWYRLALGVGVFIGMALAAS